MGGVLEFAVCGGDVGTVLDYWAFVERHGLLAWMEYVGGRPDPLLVEACGFFERGVAKVAAGLEKKREKDEKQRTA